MRLYLVKNQHLLFEQSSISSTGTIAYRSVTITTELSPPGHSSLARIFGKKFEKLLAADSVQIHGKPVSYNLKISLGAPWVGGHSTPFIKIETSDKDRGTTADLFESIHRVTNGKVHLKLKMKNFGSVHIYSEDLQDRRVVNSSVNIDNYRVELSTEPMQIAQTGPTQQAHCQGDLLKFPSSFCGFWKEGNCIFRGLFSIALIFDDNQGDPAVPIPDRFSINREMLMEEISTDLTITAGNGAVIRCHKIFLAAHSPVLRIMFESNLEETKTNNIDMSDLTEEGVRAFLSYLYCWDIDKAEESCDVAFQLFYAGHKYDITRLEKCMEDLLLSKHDGWYESEVAFKMFLFARNMEKGKDLVEKAVQILKMNASNLDESIDYRTAFKEDPSAGLELCKHAFFTK